MNKEEKKICRKNYYQKNKEIWKRYYQENEKEIKEYKKELHKNMKIKCLLYYSNKEYPVCECCKINNIDILTIDHVNGDGRNHRRKHNITGGGIYRWIIKNNFPIGYRVLCFNCNSGKGKNKECPHILTRNNINIKTQKGHYKYYRFPILNKFKKEDIIICNNCGEKNILFLCIDHINGNGTFHINKFKDHRKYQIWLKTKADPKDFQILCQNCNHMKHLNPQNLIKFGKTQRAINIIKHNPII